MTLSLFIFVFSHLVIFFDVWLCDESCSRESGLSCCEVHFTEKNVFGVKFKNLTFLEMYGRAFKG